MTGEIHFFHILWGSDPVVKGTLLILAGLSIVCWTIIFFKQKELQKLSTSSLRFFEAFWEAKNLEDLAGKFGKIDTPPSNILSAVVGESSGGRSRSRTIRTGGLRRRVERAVQEEVERLERYVPFLATTGSSAPFIGLFGTVWGILTAFWQIGRAGSTSLAVVGPYIAEALIATAFGLFAAIPAVIAYNHFVNRIRYFIRDLEGFGEDLIQRVEADHGRS